MYHVYLIRSEIDPSKYYKGFTTDIGKRLEKHNCGEVRSTTTLKPWELQTLISFDSRVKALQFERYLKSHSGRAFSSKHF
ncbi:MAG: GIY-YIG nuclease family protein [Candidatus Marinimicrobia bacterium]|nr:GIY-YIG nuclease family protein [Candidatus Neomarinimicrobiota bacterium]